MRLKALPGAPHSLAPKPAPHGQRDRPRAGRLPKGRGGHACGIIEVHALAVSQMNNRCRHSGHTHGFAGGDAAAYSGCDAVSGSLASVDVLQAALPWEPPSGCVFATAIIFFNCPHTCTPAPMYGRAPVLTLLFSCAAGTGELKKRDTAQTRCAALPRLLPRMYFS